MPSNASTPRPRPALPGWVARGVPWRWVVIVAGYLLVFSSYWTAPGWAMLAMLAVWTVVAVCIHYWDR